MILDRPVVVGPFQVNCWIVVCSRTREAMVIDPGDDCERILKALRALGTESGGRSEAKLTVKYLFHTHAHLDHFGATRTLCEALEGEFAPVSRPKILLHRADSSLWNELQSQGAMFGLTYDPPLPVDQFVLDGESFKVGDLCFTVIHTPGHSPGGLSLRLHADPAAGISETVFSGDTLFQGSIGRTDLWGGDMDVLLSSIRERLFVLDDATRVCPGHGPETKIGIEKRENPFIL